MMRLPALLAAKIAKARTARTLRSRLGGPFEFVNAADILHSGSAHPVSLEKIRDILASPAAAVWIRGAEPLDHPGIAHLVRALAPGGHYLFLETDGALLRRRIHEFQPLPRVFLTVRLDTRRDAELDLAVEGLRAARLSGFFTVVLSRIGESSNIAAVERLRSLVLDLDADGWLITSDSANPDALRKSSEARVLLPGAGWRWFSTQLERELLSQAKGGEAHEATVSQEPQSESYEEGVKVA